PAAVARPTVALARPRAVTARPMLSAQPMARAARPMWIQLGSTRPHHLPRLLVPRLPQQQPYATTLTMTCRCATHDAVIVQSAVSAPEQSLTSVRPRALLRQSKRIEEQRF